jgi:hypothetical protein
LFSSLTAQETSRFHYRVYNSPSIDSILSQLTPVHTLFPYDPFQYYIPTYVCLPQVSFSLKRLPLKTEYTFNISAMHATCLYHFLLLDLVTLKMFTLKEEPFFFLVFCFFSHTKIGCTEAGSYVLEVKLIHLLLFILPRAIGAYVITGVPPSCILLASSLLLG